MQDVRSLLRLEFETLWVTDDNGRLTRPRTSERRPAPLLAVASGDTHLVWAISAAVADDVAGKIDKVLAGEVPEPALAPGWRPRTVRLLLDLLGEQAAPDGDERGPSFVLVEVPEPVVGIECWTSIHVDRDELFGLMPEDDRRGLVAPWAVAVANGEVAAVCETARSAPTSVEAGVWTYEPFRGQGFGTAVTAAWARLAAKRVVFHSTTFDNLASQRIAGKLGFRSLGDLVVDPPSRKSIGALTRRSGAPCESRPGSSTRRETILL